LSLPFVSILIPIRNESAYIQRCLQAVLAQGYPTELMEILIADGMSTDNTRLILQKIQSEQPHIKLIDNPPGIVPTGLNSLISQAKGEVLIRVDGHCMIEPDYISNCIHHLQNDNVDGVGGPMRSIGEDFTSEVIALAMSSKFGVGNSSFRTETGQTKLADTVPFPAYTRAIIEKVGLYDEELVRNQDDEYNYRIREAGGKILLADDVRSTYYSRGSLSKLWKQYFGYGFWKVRVLQKHPRQMSLRQFIPPLFVLGLLFSLLIAGLFNWGWIMPLVVLIAYLLAAFASAIKEGRALGFKAIILLPLVFAVIHLGYGSGFLWGLVKFSHRWGDKVGKVPKDRSLNGKQ